MGIYEPNNTLIPYIACVAKSIDLSQNENIDR